MLKENSMNWLSFVEELKLNINNLCDESLEELLEDLIRFIHNSDLTDTEKKLGKPIVSSIPCCQERGQQRRSRNCH